MKSSWYVLWFSPWTVSYTHLILNAYEHWSSSVPEAGALIVFDSMWHSTETMAQTIAEAFTEKGVPVKPVSYTHLEPHMEAGS